MMVEAVVARTVLAQCVRRPVSKTESMSTTATPITLFALLTQTTTTASRGTSLRFWAQASGAVRCRQTRSFKVIQVMMAKKRSYPRAFTKTHFLQHHKRWRAACARSTALPKRLGGTPTATAAKASHSRRLANSVRRWLGPTHAEWSKRGWASCRPAKSTSFLSSMASCQLHPPPPHRQKLHPRGR